MTAAVLNERDQLVDLLLAWRHDIITTPYDRVSLLAAVAYGVPLLAEPHADHMPTVPALRVVEPRFPRAAAALRWATTVGALGLAVGCLAAAGVLAAAIRAGVQW